MKRKSWTIAENGSASATAEDGVTTAQAIFVEHQAGGGDVFLSLKVGDLDECLRTGDQLELLIPQDVVQILFQRIDAEARFRRRSHRRMELSSKTAAVLKKIPAPIGNRIPSLKASDEFSFPPSFPLSKLRGIGVTHMNQLDAIAALSRDELYLLKGIGRKTVRWLEKHFGDDRHLISGA